ncbi:MAG: hypothetical protein LBJ73_02085 [Rickettsiales bacterium]|nr:hypothetical protein [Rickettsiales bacterium]
MTKTKNTISELVNFGKEALFYTVVVGVLGFLTTSVWELVLNWGDLQSFAWDSVRNVTLYFAGGTAGLFAVVGGGIKLTDFIKSKFGKSEKVSSVSVKSNERQNVNTRHYSHTVQRSAEIDKSSNEINNVKKSGQKLKQKRQRKSNISGLNLIRNKLWQRGR